MKAIQVGFVRRNACACNKDIAMNTLKTDQAGHAVSSAEGAGDSMIDRAARQSCAALAIARDAGEHATRSTESLTGLQVRAKPQSLRLAIKVKGKILFVNLRDVVSVQAKGKCVYLQWNASSYLLRESISVVAEKLETHGFIRIHRSVLVNTSFVEEIKPLSTGEYCLRVEDGKEYTVTRTYKRNLKSLAQFWIGTGAFFPG
jgi:DNA-binding LytR/AlgR family response regulator